MQAHLKPGADLAVADTEVLICDDDPQVGQMLFDLLTDTGFKATVVRSGWDAIGRLSEKEIHIAVVDKNLPDISGLEVIRLGLQASPDTVFIIVTAYSSLETAMEAMDLGAAAYVSKPFDLPGFLDRMDLARRRASQNRLIHKTLRSSGRESLGRSGPGSAAPRGSTNPGSPVTERVRGLQQSLMTLESLEKEVRGGAMDSKKLLETLGRVIELLRNLLPEDSRKPEPGRSSVPSLEKGT